MSKNRKNSYAAQAQAISRAQSLNANANILFATKDFDPLRKFNIDINIVTFFAVNHFQNIFSRKHHFSILNAIRNCFAPKLRLMH